MRSMIGGIPQDDEYALPSDTGVGLWGKLKLQAGLDTGGTMPGMTAVTGMGGSPNWAAGLGALGAGLKDTVPDRPRSMVGALGIGGLMGGSTGRGGFGGSTSPYRVRRPSDDIDTSWATNMLRFGGR